MATTPTPIADATTLVVGHDYALHYNVSWWLPTGAPTSDDILSVIKQYAPALGQPTVDNPVTTSDFTISFTYQSQGVYDEQNGGYTIYTNEQIGTLAKLVEDILNNQWATAGISASFTYLGSYDGRQSASNPLAQWVTYAVIAAVVVIIILVLINRIELDA